MTSNKITRAFTGLPLLAFSIGCFTCMGREDALRLGEQILPTGRISWDFVDIPIVQTFYGVGFVDKLFWGICIAFGPSAFGVDPVAWYQMFSFLLDVSLLYMIWMIESYKPVNLRTPSYLPVLFGFSMQLFSAGVVAPVYFYLHYVTSTPDTLRRPQLHELDAPSNRFLILTISIFSYIPIIMMYWGSTISIRYWWVWFWQLFPIWFGLSQIILSYINTGKTNLVKNSQAAQFAIKIFAVISGMAWLYVNLTSPYSPMTLYYPKAIEQPTFPQAMRRALQADQVFSFGAGFVWLLYLIGDMKNAGLVDRSWSSLLARGAAIFVLAGPGTLLAVAWLWRNGILTRQKSSTS